MASSSASCISVHSSLISPPQLPLGVHRQQPETESRRPSPRGETLSLALDIFEGLAAAPGYPTALAETTRCLRNLVQVALFGKSKKQTSSHSNSCMFSILKNGFFALFE